MRSSKMNQPRNEPHAYRGANGQGALVLLLLSVALPACGIDSSASPCAGVSCSEHGRCVVAAAAATCECFYGYRASALSCLPTDGETECADAASGGCGDHPVAAPFPPDPATVPTTPPADFSPLVYRDFDGGPLGEQAYPFTYAFDGTSSLGSQTYVTFDDTHVYQGDRAAQFFMKAFQKEDMGGAIHFPHVIGDEYWARVRCYFPTPTLFVENTEGNKFMRSMVTDDGTPSGGAWDWYISNGGMVLGNGIATVGQDSSAGKTLQQEYYADFCYWPNTNCRGLGGPAVVSENVWHTYEMYVKVSAHSDGIVRGYADGVKLAEYTGRTIPFEGDGLHGIKIFSGPQGGGQGEYQQDQYVWVDEIVVTDGAHPPPNADADGHPIIGDWGP